jgi:hypothetical protein
VSQHGNEIAPTENISKPRWKRLSPKDLNRPLTSFYVILTALQYLFCRIVIAPLIGNMEAHWIFLGLFLLLTSYFLLEEWIGPRLESVGLKLETFLKNHPELWFAARMIVEIAAIILIIYFLGSNLKFVGVVDWSWLKKVLLWIFLIDALVAFLAIYGTKQTQEGIRENVTTTFQQIEGIIRKDAIKEIFYLSSIVSAVLKITLMILVVAGVIGAIGIAGGILIIILPYFLFSVLYTALFITGSFGATIRYWQWLLTEPPKIVVRFIFKIRRDKIKCRHCSRIIPLTGTYECPHCHFKYKGFYFGWCPSCYSRATYIDCECGLSRKRPFIH